VKKYEELVAEKGEKEGKREFYALKIPGQGSKRASPQGKCNFRTDHGQCVAYGLFYGL